MSEILQWLADWVAVSPSAAVVAVLGGSWALAAVAYGVSALLRSAPAPPPEVPASSSAETLAAPAPAPTPAVPESAAPQRAPSELAPPRPESATPPPEPVSEPAAPAPPAEVPEPPTLSLRERLKRTSDALIGRMGALVGRNADDALFDELEATLFTADLGVQTAEDLLSRARREAGGKDGAAVRQVLRDAIGEKLRAVEWAGEPLAISGKPHVILVLGVNGSGKTTTIGKLAARYSAQGHSVILGAADTFRAAAREQLQTWGERTDCEVIVGPDEGDPAAVAFDTVKAATARGADIAIIDTAGRLQTHQPLMEELSKIARVIGRDVEGAPHETLLVLDSNTGQNALSQAKQFTAAAPVTGLVLTKLDGTAKGGVIVGLADELGIPVKHVGVGEAVGDLRDFNADEFVDALFGDD